MASTYSGSNKLIDRLAQLKHPMYVRDVDFWTKWRLTMTGGPEFVESYLSKYSNRETDADFIARKAITYCPAYAKAAITDIKNAIFQRTCDVSRIGGPDSYQQAMRGLNGGVDLQGSSMDEYIGCNILPDLLSMAKVGVYVDMPPLAGPDVASNYTKRPYLYSYRPEDILNWDYTYNTQNGCKELSMVLLREYSYIYSSTLGVPSGYGERYRFVWKEENRIFSQFYNGDSNLNSPEEPPVELKLGSIPFVIMELPESLLKDVADLQIALMNIASADLGFISQAAYPIYVEQYDPRWEGPHLKPSGDQSDAAGTSDANTGKAKEIKIGVGQGRRYPQGMDRPSFINPSSEPLKASMAKQEEMKKDIRLLVNLSVSNLNPVKAGAESKQMEDRSLESGLSFIGLILEKGERRIAEHFADYLRAKVAQISYPKTYSIRTEEDRQKEIEGHEEIMSKLPSKTFQVEVAKMIVDAKLAGRVPYETIVKIKKELDDSPAIISDEKQIHQDWLDGFVSTNTASLLRGYDAEKEVPTAQKDRAQRIRLTMEAQGGPQGQGQARGNPDGQTTQPTSPDEKAGKAKRGEGQNPGS